MVPKEDSQVFGPLQQVRAVRLGQPRALKVKKKIGSEAKKGYLHRRPYHTDEVRGLLEIRMLFHSTLNLL